MPPFQGYPDTPSGQKPLTFHMRNFQGMNQRATRQSIGDDQFTWLENLWPIQPGNLQAGPSDGTSLFATASTIVNAYFFTLQGTPYCIVFMADGTAIQFQTISGAQTLVSNIPGQFYLGGYPPVAAQFNAGGIVIAAADQINGYFAWDGVTLYSAGMAAPNWLTNQTPTTMPAGLRGSQIEVYQNRVWVTTPPSGTVPATINTSAPSNGADFNPADGAVTTPQQDSALKFQFNALKQSNGFLYLIGDSSINIISNVITQGSPVVTTYANQNANPQEGTLWPNSAQIFEQALIYANFKGVYVLNGGVVQKISDDVDDLFINASFATTPPTAAVASVFNIKHYMIMLNTVDFANVRRNVILVWNGRQWFVASSLNPNTKMIFGQEFNSELVAWGSDGNHMYPLFQVFSISLPKQLQTKLFCGGDNDDGWISYKKSYRFYWNVKDLSGDGIVLAATMDNETSSTPLVVSSQTLTATYEFVNNTAQLIHFQNGSSQTIVWGVFSAAASSINFNDEAIYGLLLGWTAQFIGGDYSIIAMAMQYTHDAPLGG